jgi:hypothetical protein
VTRAERDLRCRDGVALVEQSSGGGFIVGNVEDPIQAEESESLHQ